MGSRAGVRSSSRWTVSGLQGCRQKGLCPAPPSHHRHSSSSRPGLSSHMPLCPCLHAPGHAQPHSRSCTEMRLSLPSSWVTGWHQCKVSCTGAVESGKSSRSIVSTGSCLSVLGCRALVSCSLVTFPREKGVGREKVEWGVCEARSGNRWPVLRYLLLPPPPAPARLGTH